MRRTATALAVAASLACATSAQAVDRTTLDRINDAMAASYGIRLPVRYAPMPADGRIAQLRPTAKGFVVELDPSWYPDDVAETCETVAHEYTHWTRRDYEKNVEQWHLNWPQDEAQPYPACRAYQSQAAARRRLEDRAWKLQVWLDRAKPLSWKNCRTAKARRQCVRQVDAKWRHRRQVRRELARIDRQLGTPTLQLGPTDNPSLKPDKAH